MNENGASSEIWNTASPKIAITMSGVPATTSMLDSTTRASQLGRPYSDSHTALASASGSANAMPISVNSSVPSSGSRKPPDPAWVVLGSGRLKIRLGRT